MCTNGCFVQTRPNIGAIFGQTNNTFDGTLSYVLPLFPHCTLFFNKSFYSLFALTLRWEVTNDAAAVFVYHTQTLSDIPLTVHSRGHIILQRC